MLEELVEALSLSVLDQRREPGVIVSTPHWYKPSGRFGQALFSWKRLFEIDMTFPDPLSTIPFLDDDKSPRAEP